MHAVARFLFVVALVFGVAECEGASVSWSFNLTSTVSAAPVVVGSGVLVAAGSQVVLVNFKGSSAWSYVLPSGVAAVGTPAVDQNGNIYVAANDTNVYVLSASGSLAYVYPVTLDIVTSPVAVALQSGNITIALGAAEGTIISLAPSGTNNWNTAGLGYIWSSGVGVDSASGDIYATTQEGLTAVDGDGNFLWTYNAALSYAQGDGAGGAPLVDTNQSTIVFPDAFGNLTAVGIDGNSTWTYHNPAGSRAVFCTPAFGPVYGSYIAADLLGTVHMIQGGKAAWTYALAGTLLGCAVTTNIGDTYATSTSGSAASTLQVLDYQGNLQWSYDFDGIVSGASPAVDGEGNAYVAVGSTVYAVVN